MPGDVNLLTVSQTPSKGGFRLMTEPFAATNPPRSPRNVGGGVSLGKDIVRAGRPNETALREEPTERR